MESFICPPPTHRSSPSSSFTHLNLPCSGWWEGGSQGQTSISRCTAPHPPLHGSPRFCLRSRSKHIWRPHNKPEGGVACPVQSVLSVTKFPLNHNMGFYCKCFKCYIEGTLCSYVPHCFLHISTPRCIECHFVSSNTKIEPILTILTIFTKRKILHGN